MYCKIILVCLYLSTSFCLAAQPAPLRFIDGTTAKRNAFTNKIINGIQNTLTLSFDSANDSKWQSTFYNIGLIQYKPTAVSIKITEAANVLINKNFEFQKSFINLINSNYPSLYNKQITDVFFSTTDAKLLAMAANYLLPNSNTNTLQQMKIKVAKALQNDPDNAILTELTYQLINFKKQSPIPNLSTFFSKKYLPGSLLVLSLQRKNRNYPGLVLVRDTAGLFVTLPNGSPFAVGQLARSNSNMPGYISLGNTPQGIFKITGFDTSTNYFIGPTPNLQLAMPHEYSAHISNHTLVDSTWTMDQYKNMLPDNFKNFHPLWGTFYAGKAGRTEIIAHGTTINPSYFKNTSYYPYTPSAGCLCTKEIWSTNTGILEVSDQLLLAQAVQKAGGPYGLLIVIEIDDKQLPVSIADIKKYIATK